jgi:signal transduction histidine kinase
LSFRVAARTVLELGAELISSDAVAIYELVKNAIDAQSKDGVTIEFCVTLRYSDYTDALARIDTMLANIRRRVKVAPDAVAEVKASLLSNIVQDAPRAARLALSEIIRSATTLARLRENLIKGYVDHNWIEFRDTGLGMSKKDLLDNYMVIGTPSRRRDLDARIKSGQDAAYLGEKGVGRLSAMRLGSRLLVRTASEKDRRFNLVDVDWSQFEDLDKMIEDVVITPKLGAPKPAAWTGTVIRVSGLNATWSVNRIRDIATFELARLSDPFSKAKRRYRIVVLFNDSRVSIPRLDQEILGLAHATATGRYEFDDDGQPQLTIDLACGDLGKKNPPETRHLVLQRIDVRSITKDRTNEVPASALRTVGPFSFDLYWFNRQFLRKQLSTAEGKRILPLQKQWSGIMLFRNAYRVFPYGDDTDDWLGLDRRALASGGYKLNKTQFIGRASITRTGNPRLIDQTSREGLKDCDEKTVLVELLRFVIQDRMRKFLDDVEKRHSPDLDLDAADKRVDELQARTQAAIRGLLRRHADEAPNLRELLAFFEEMHAYFAAARKRATEVEDERERMVQLAGVGLMLEMIAHELARSTETALGLLTDANEEELPEDVAALFGTLRDEMKTMNRRLRVLDPLSVSGRQRKESFDLVQLVGEIFTAHKAQFERHHVTPSVKVASGGKKVMVHGVRGMFVQIVENLVQNSIYWMDLRREDDETYSPRIDVVLDDATRLIDYTDNGPGIHPSLRDEVFTAFFSTKGKSQRQGLGLYIAQDCATSNGAQLQLLNERRIHKDRLNTFVLEKSEDAS